MARLWRKISGKEAAMHFSGQQLLTTVCVFKSIAILNNADKGKTNCPALLLLTFFLQIARQIKWRPFCEKGGKHQESSPVSSTTQ